MYSLISGEKEGGREGGQRFREVLRLKLGGGPFAESHTVAAFGAPSSPT